MATTLGKQSYDADELQARQGIVDLARRIGFGQWASQLCPKCNGGTSRERTLSIDVGQNGVLKFNCFRASCGFAGTAYTNQGLGPHIAETPTPGARELRPLTADLHPLADSELDWFQSHFGLPPAWSKHGLYRTQSRYALPIFRPNGTHRGYITRRPWDGSGADTAENRLDPQWGMKALTYLEADEPVQSWFSTMEAEHSMQAVVCVEDPISAMRLTSYWETTEGAEFPMAAVAILGTGLNAGKIHEIQQVARSADVYIALDADATGQAFAMARKWGPGFRRLNVIVLQRDIKDMTDDEIARLPL
jgi:hypothetical protein